MTKKKSKNPMNRLMVYLKAREVLYGIKEGRATDLNQDMLLALHSMGMREFNGVGVDEDYKLVYDKENPEFLVEFNQG